LLMKEWPFFYIQYLGNLTTSIHHLLAAATSARSPALLATWQEIRTRLMGRQSQSPSRVLHCATDFSLQFPGLFFCLWWSPSSDSDQTNIKVIWSDKCMKMSIVNTQLVYSLMQISDGLALIGPFSALIASICAQIPPATWFFSPICQRKKTTTMAIYKDHP
jgi:hypothetical protein